MKRGWILALALCLTPIAAQARDNFLILVLDDVGVNGIDIYSRDDVYGHPGEGAAPGPTPNIDDLAAAGVLFRNAWAAPVCGPSRFATMTGRYAFRTGAGSNGQSLSEDDVILPEIVAGTHRNAAIGKWHLGGGRNDTDHPIEVGFEYYAGGLGGGIGDYEAWRKVTNSTTTATVIEDPYTTYATTDVVDEALARIAEYGEEPWLLWLAFNASHSPFHVPPGSLTTMAVDAGSDTPTKWKAAIEAADTEIGRLLANIPDDVLADTTIILLGDNGTPRGATEMPFDNTRAKGSVYEGGVNVPFIVVSPRVDPVDAGSESNALIHVVDIFATIAEIAGASAGTEDSVSLVPYLENPSLPTQAGRTAGYAESFTPNGPGPYTSEDRVIRDDRYKLIWRDGAPAEFYDLQDDRWEDQNLLPESDLTPEQAAAYGRMLADMETIRASGPQCADGVDNDLDGRIDFPDDLGCADAASDDESPACDDGVDNDGDGRVDWDGDEGLFEADPVCSGNPSRNRESTTRCGLGAELTLVAPLLGWLGRRRRRAGVAGRPAAP